MQTIPELVGLLYSNDVSTKKTAITELTTLLNNNQDDQVLQAQICTREVVDRLVFLLRDEEIKIKVAAANLIGWLGRDNQIHQDVIYNAGAIVPLVDLLSIDHAVYLEIIIKVLSCLLSEKSPTIQTAIREARGLDMLVQLLRAEKSKIRREAADVLSFLAHENTINQNAIHQAGAIYGLFKLVCAKNLEGRQIALATLGVLTRENPMICTEIGEKGGIVPLIRLLRVEEDIIVIQRTLNILFDLAYKNPINQAIISETGGIVVLVNLLSADDEDTKCLVIDLLKKLTDDNPENQSAFFNAGGIPKLKSLSSSEDPRTKESAINLLQYIDACFVVFGLRNLDLYIRAKSSEVESFLNSGNVSEYPGKFFSTSSASERPGEEDLEYEDGLVFHDGV